LTLTAYGADDSLSEQPEQPLPPLRRLERARVSGNASDTARGLLGALLVRDDATGRRVGRIVETEAYAGPTDKASHARAGRTPRTNVMFGPPGHAYVYLVYGMHHCLNVVCATDGEASAVLIRAVEPVAGLATMRTRRGATNGPDVRLAAGPARTCQAFDIDRGLDGLDLIRDGWLWLAADPDGPLASSRILSGARVGVDYAGPEWAAKPWRFGVAGSTALSKPFPRTS
jgi:DNA-3-methyladenine glycosylase